MHFIPNDDQYSIAGGLHIGASVMSIATGFFLGGPVGVGFAVASIIGAQGIDNLVDLYKKP